MKTHHIGKGNDYDGTDYDYGVCSLDQNFVRDFINNYIKENNMSKKYFSEKYNLTYSSFLKFLKGNWDYRYDSVCIKIIQNQERVFNKEKYELDFTNCDIEFVKLFCNFIKNNQKNTIIIGGTNYEKRFDNIISYLKDNDINIEITRVYNGKGDHDPYIVFKINSYSNDNIDNILNMFESV